MLSAFLNSPAVLIGDLVASRRAADRPALHDDLLQALAFGNEATRPRHALAPSVGDEFQGVFETLVDALLASVLVRASMSEGNDARFGIGVGEVIALGSGAQQDGPAWWAAREAIGYVAGAGKSRQVPASLRTWVAVPPELPSEPDEAGADLGALHAVNAYLAARDHLVTRMDARNRRILRGLLLRWPLARIGAAEGVTASAVSQRSTRSGATQIAFAHAQLARGAG